MTGAETETTGSARKTKFMCVHEHVCAVTHLYKQESSLCFLRPLLYGGGWWKKRQSINNLSMKEKKKELCVPEAERKQFLRNSN